MNLKELSLFITDPLIVDVKESSQHILANRFMEKHGLTVEANQKSALVEEPSENYADEDRVALVYEGEFKKGILVIYTGKGLSEQNTEFLLKVLQAVGCSLGDIALVSEQALEGTGLKSLESLAPNKVLVFGRINHPLMQWRKENYEVYSQAESTEYFYADELDEFTDNIPLKKKLWTSLQVLFNIK